MCTRAFLAVLSLGGSNKRVTGMKEKTNQLMLCQRQRQYQPMNSLDPGMYCSLALLVLILNIYESACERTVYLYHLERHSNATAS